MGRRNTRAGQQRIGVIERGAAPESPGFSASAVPTLLQSKGCARGLLRHLRRPDKAGMKRKRGEYIAKGQKVLPFCL